MGRRKKSQNKEINILGKKEPLSQLLDAIKSDDEKLFTEMVTQNKSYLNLCFGRFPLLSLCYLYKSRKIAAVYEKSLLNFSAYVYVDEDYDCYRLFRKYAKRWLRFYILDNIVSPLEMLAVMGDSLYLVEKYDDSQKDTKTVNRIKNIYRTLHSQDIEITSASIAIKRRPLNTKQKYRIFAVAVVAVLIAALCGASWWGFSALSGKDTAENPYRVAGEKQLKAAIEKGAHIVIAKDFILKKQWQPSDFSGSIDGNGHTVFVGTNMPKGLFKTLEGKLENTNFVFEGLDMKITENTALITHINNGYIGNLNIKVKGKFVTNAPAVSEDEPSPAIYLSLLAHENNGEINRCQLDANVSVTGEGGHDAFFSGITSLNSGIIKGCSTKAGKFLTDTVDVAAIVAENKLGATVSQCINNAEVSQSTANTNWLPNVGGVVLHNYGTVTDCINNGALSAVSTASETVLNVYVGGIVCINSNKIIKSKNNSGISAKSQNHNIYAGGVAAFNSGSIDNSCAYGTISVEASAMEGPFLFAGAIAGSLSGGVTNSFALTTYSSVGQNVYLGGIIGVADYFSANNNYYVEQPNVAYGIAGILSGFYVYGGSDSGITKVTSIDEIKAIEGVYWQ